MKTKTDRHILIQTSRIHHRWPFLPCDNGRYSGKLVYQAYYISIEVLKIKPYKDETPFNLPGGRRYMKSQFNSILSHYFTNNYRSRISGHMHRMQRDQSAAQARRLGILQIN